MTLGTLDEATGEYIQAPELENGHWYLDDEGLLYIVPNDLHGIAEIEGPDGDTMDELNARYRKAGFENINTEELAKALDLDFIPDVLRRFDPQSGFYTA